MRPNLYQEKRLTNKGYKVIGIDEAGRGPLAGAVMACAVLINLNKVDKKIFNLIRKKANDTKVLSLKRREEVYNLTLKCSGIVWGKGKASEKIIDKVNILEATKLAMEKALRDLRKKTRLKKEYLIIDGNFSLNCELIQKSVIKADKKVLSCSLAGILAKVLRDRMMERYHKKYPLYGFDKHKGYPTKFHKKMIKKNGLSVIHRKTFSSI
jgi:ribonuclease HII